MLQAMDAGVQYVFDGKEEDISMIVGDGLRVMTVTGNSYSLNGSPITKKVRRGSRDDETCDEKGILDGKGEPDAERTQQAAVIIAPSDSPQREVVN